MNPNQTMEAGAEESMAFDLEGVDGRRAQGINRRREQGWLTTLAIHGVVLASDALLHTVVQKKDKDAENSHVETRMAFTSSLVGLFVYVYAATLQIILVQTNNDLNDLIMRILNHILVCSQSLYLLSVGLVSFPNTVGWIVIVPFVFATTILLAYDGFNLISNCVTPTSEPGTGISDNAATTFGSIEMSTGIGHGNAAATSQSTEASTGINNDESSAQV